MSKKSLHSGYSSPRGRGIRKLHEKSKMQLCSYIPCRHGDKCARAHSEEELESWRSQLRATPRSFVEDDHPLALCNGQWCKGMDCMYAHSQEELDRWHEEAADVMKELCETIRDYSPDHGDHLLKLCNYIGKYCKNENDCKYAHSQKELDQWNKEAADMKKELCATIRDYSPDQHQLKLCNYIEDPSKYCRKEYDCIYAHSPEELKAWWEIHPFRTSEGKVLEKCPNAHKCTRKEKCHFAHNDKELQAWKEEHHQKYLQSESSIPERCRNTIVQSCQQGTGCHYAHTDEEREELIEKLARYDKEEPRPVPRADKLLPYSLCENHKNKWKRYEGECIFGIRCEQPHSSRELKSWEAQRKAEQQKQPSVRLFDECKCRLEMCKSNGRCGGEQCCYAHSEEELKEWIRNSRSAMLGPPGPGDKQTHSDPFLICLVDYLRRCSDQLATVLNAVVMNLRQDCTLKGKLGSYIDYNREQIDLTSEEGQNSASLYDIQYLLGYLQRNCSIVDDYLGIGREYLAGVVSDLLEIRNKLAHGVYDRNGQREEESDITAKFIQRGIDFVRHLAGGPVGMQNGKISNGYASLVNLQETFRDFLVYQKQRRRQMEEYSSMGSKEKRERALKALQTMKTLLECEAEPGPVTMFAATSLSARFRSQD